jgi:hypothetical protein
MCLVRRNRDTAHHGANATFNRGHVVAIENRLEAAVPQ